MMGFAFSMVFILYIPTATAAQCKVQTVHTVKHYFISNLTMFSSTAVTVSETQQQWRSTLCMLISGDVILIRRSNCVLFVAELSDC